MTQTKETGFLENFEGCRLGFDVFIRKQLDDCEDAADVYQETALFFIIFVLWRQPPQEQGVATANPKYIDICLEITGKAITLTCELKHVSAAEIQNIISPYIVVTLLNDTGSSDCSWRLIVLFFFEIILNRGAIR